MASKSATTMLIDLIRHGEPEGGRKFRGHRDDPLSATGWHQMTQAVSGPAPWDAIVSSPLKRCREFAERLAEQQGLPVTIDAGFKEISFGDWEGLTWEAVIERFGQQALDNFWRNPIDHPPSSGEPFLEFRQRVLRAWADLTERVGGQRILVVAHGGVIRTILGEVMGIPPERTMGAVAVPFACLSRVRIDVSEYGSLACLERHGIADSDKPVQSNQG